MWHEKWNKKDLSTRRKRFERIESALNSSKSIFVSEKAKYQEKPGVESGAVSKLQASRTVHFIFAK